MCIVCVLWDKGKLTRREAQSAFSEVVRDENFDKNHIEEFNKKVELAKKKEMESDSFVSV
jgi:hypothetical protein